MNKLMFLLPILLLMGAGCRMDSLEPVAYTHTVLFDLKAAPDSPEAAAFLAQGTRALTSVPGVMNFRAVRQCSPKSDFQYAFLMDFASKEAFRAYCVHPDHNRFVDDYWKKEVVRFFEADYIDLPVGK